MSRLESVCRWFAQPYVIRLGHSTTKKKNERKKSWRSMDEYCTVQDKSSLHTRPVLYMITSQILLVNWETLLIYKFSSVGSSIQTFIVSYHRQLTRASRSCPCLGNIDLPRDNPWFHTYVHKLVSLVFYTLPPPKKITFVASALLDFEGENRLATWSIDFLNNVYYALFSQSVTAG